MANQVSVILPTYNAQRFIASTLEGIANQDFPDFEVIIVDDGSDDKTRDIIHRWNSDNLISCRLIFLPGNFGVCNALRIGIEASAGMYIAQIGHDDVWCTNHLSSLVEAIGQKHVAAFSQIRYINSEGRPIEKNIFDHDRIDLSDRHKLFVDLLQGNFLCAPASMFRKSAYSPNYLGVNNERLQDYQLWLNLILNGSFSFTRSSTCLYRVHDANLSSGDTMERQSKSELFTSQQQVLTRQDFSSFMNQISDEKNYFSYICRKMIESMLHISDYFTALPLLYVGVLDQMQNVFPHSLEIREGRMRMASKLGLLRKNLAIGKLSPLTAFAYNLNVPYLVPLGSRAEQGAFHMLIELGCFKDGTGVDIVGNGISNFFFFVSNVELEQFASEPLLVDAQGDGRVVVCYDGPPKRYNCMLYVPKERDQYSYRVFDFVLRYFEDFSGFHKRVDLVGW